MEPLPGGERKTEVVRFISALAAGLRALHLYKTNNKALEDILENLLSRFRAVGPEPTKLGITNRSLVFEGEPLGSAELTGSLALVLRTLGFKEIIFRPPLQGRNFFQLLNILANQDPLEVKQEKLALFVGEEDEKPIRLVPLITNSGLMRLSDEGLAEKLAPLAKLVAEGGSGIYEELETSPPANLPDLYTRLAVRAESLERTLCSFVRDLVDAVREGHFAADHFLEACPLPPKVKSELLNKLSFTLPPPQRRPTPLGMALHPLSRRPSGSPVIDWASRLVAFSKEELKQRSDLRTFGSQQNGLVEIEMAENMLREKALNFLLGLRILIRVLVQQNATTVQERAVKNGLAIWLRREEAQDDMAQLSLLSSLRQALALPHNIVLTLFPLRSVAPDSEMFIKLTAYMVSLGDIAMAPLIEALSVEEDRGMRRKLCLVLTNMAREQGTTPLMAALEKASPFLLRNIVMILGDTRSQQALTDLSKILDHDQRIVRIEVIHSLGKIGTPESTKVLLRIVENTSGAPDERKAALDQLMVSRDHSLAEPLHRITRLETSGSEFKTDLITALATLGGPAAKQFLESLQKGSSLLSGFSEGKDEQTLISNLLKKWPPS